MGELIYMFASLAPRHANGVTCMDGMRLLAKTLHPHGVKIPLTMAARCGNVTEARRMAPEHVGEPEMSVAHKREPKAHIKSAHVKTSRGKNAGMPRRAPRMSAAGKSAGETREGDIIQTTYTRKEALWLRRLNEEKRYFDGIRESLERDPRYRGKFVAVTGKKVVDADEDDMALIARASKKHSHKAIFIGTVGFDLPAVSISSPEIVA